uniref:Tubulin--tyrosine ligase-like protein 9 n=1 Tax=Helobdella robusta TaxID=6412 RepID=T1G5C5_HELRO
MSNCKYEAVHSASQRFGFRLVNELDEWNLLWSDSCVPLSKLMDMKKFQKVNHFPGMLEICRKDLLARNLNRALKLFPKEYNFFPKTFYLPADFSEFRTYTRHRKRSIFILKPENNCQGSKGIRLARNTKVETNGEHVLCQHYISRPYLVDNLKFDLRIYVLVTCCDPLRIYVYNEGLARFATVPYQQPNKNNIDNVFMHLTNYSINKRSKDFNTDEDSGNKRRLSTIYNILEGEGKDVKKLISEIDDIIIKTIISICSVLKRNHISLFLRHTISSACFEILGFDILLDKDLKPFLLEVNHSPSFAMDTPLDREIKEGLIFDTLRMIDFNRIDKKKCLEEKRKYVTCRLTPAQKTFQLLLVL